MPKIAEEKRKIKTFYWSSTEQGLLDEVRDLLIKIDKEKYGWKYVKAELDKKNKGKYSDSMIMRFIIEKAGGLTLKMLSEELESLRKGKKKKKPEKTPNPIERIVKDVSDRSDLYWLQAE